jgi:hypothetical protein
LPVGGKVTPSAAGKQGTIMTAMRTILLSALVLAGAAAVTTWSHASLLTAVAVPAGIDPSAIQSQMDLRALPEQAVTLDWISETSRFNRAD